MSLSQVVKALLDHLELLTLFLTEVLVSGSGHLVQSAILTLVSFYTDRFHTL